MGPDSFLCACEGDQNIPSQYFGDKKQLKELIKAQSLAQLTAKPAVELVRRLQVLGDSRCSQGIPGDLPCSLPLSCLPLFIGLVLRWALPKEEQMGIHSSRKTVYYLSNPAEKDCQGLGTLHSSLPRLVNLPTYRVKGKGESI